MTTGTAKRSVTRQFAVPAAMIVTGTAGLLVLSMAAPPGNGLAGAQPSTAQAWLAGDHHVHSEFSVDYNDSTAPPTPLIGQDGRYAISLNAQRARQYGLSWMVSTDHGGPNHSKLNRDLAYPALVESRRTVPEVIQFYGMEFDTPAADHSSLIIPHSSGERDALYDIESRFAKRDKFPRDSTWDREPRMVEALRFMASQPQSPVLIANHPSRSATAASGYGQDTPAEFRNWNDAAPRVAVGMEGAPGHQAGTLNQDGSLDSTGARGSYSRYATMGGFDQMTARVGGLWDSMLGEGRRWWITSTSDSHRNWRDGGNDFWPGEYSKTFVHASRSHADILDGIRHGRTFVTIGDLVSEVWLTADVGSARDARVMFGSTLVVPRATRTFSLTIRVRDPREANHNGDRPEVTRVDLIAGAVTGAVEDRSADSNPTANVVRRFTASDWTRDGEFLTMRHTFSAIEGPFYFRLRGTNSSELEPAPDPRGENPWSDLWFYSNPVFVELR
jgi:hypothetical protein